MNEHGGKHDKDTVGLRPRETRHAEPDPSMAPPPQHQPTGVEQATANILEVAEVSAREYKLDYAEIVRALTNALVTVNEQHREIERAA